MIGCSCCRLSLLLPIRSVPTMVLEMGGGAASHVMLLFSRGFCLFLPGSEDEGGDLLPSLLYFAMYLSMFASSNARRGGDKAQRRCMTKIRLQAPSLRRRATDRRTCLLRSRRRRRRTERRKFRLLPPSSLPPPIQPSIDPSIHRSIVISRSIAAGPTDRRRRPRRAASQPRIDLGHLHSISPFISFSFFVSFHRDDQV